MNARKVFAVLVIASLFLTIQSSKSLMAIFDINAQTEQTEFIVSAPTGEQWQMVYGGTEDDIGRAVVQIPGGGFAVAGYTQSFDAEDTDMWFVRVGEDGTVVSSHTYGTPEVERAYDLCHVSTGGYALAGCRYPGGVGDFNVVRLDEAGSWIWEFSEVTGSSYDEAQALIETSDGELLVAGYSNEDARIIKINATTGIELWSYNYDGLGIEFVRDVIEVVDGYAIIGDSHDGLQGDIWLLKIDFDGNHLWNRTLGSPQNDYGHSIAQGNTGGLVLAGSTESLDGNHDMWMVFTDDLGIEISNRTFGGPLAEQAHAITPTRDSDGYVLAGYTKSYGAGGDDMYFVRTDNNGDFVWDMTNGSISSDRAYGVTSLSDGGFIITGYTNNVPNSYDLRMTRLWYDTEGPEFTNLPADVYFYLNEYIYFQVQATEYSGYKNWWLNDSKFSVTFYGYITNTTTLDVGTYVVQVNAMDMYYNPTSSYVRFFIEIPTTTTTTSMPTTTPTSTTTTTPTTTITPTSSIQPPPGLEGTGLLLLGIGTGSIALAMAGLAKLYMNKKEKK